MWITSRAAIAALLPIRKKFMSSTSEVGLMERCVLSVCLASEVNRALEVMLCQYHIGLDVCNSLDRAERRMEKQRFCLIILDVTAVTTDQALRHLDWIRKLSYAPILLFTPCGSEDKLISAGADQCVFAGASVKAVLSAAFSLLRRYLFYDHYDEVWPLDAVICRGGIVFDHLRHRVTLNGEEIHFPPKEYKLLHYFVRNPGIVISPEQICDRVWGVEFDGNRDVTTAIAELRRKLKDIRRKPIYIKTIHGFGYQFIL